MKKSGARRERRDERSGKEFVSANRFLPAVNRARRGGELFLPILFLLASVFSGSACQANQSILNSKPQSDSSTSSSNIGGGGGGGAAPGTNSFDRDLQTMQTANFDFIYVFRRKDGGELTGEDKRFLKANSPAETNRFLVADGGRAVIAGSSYRFAPENLAALRSGFAVEDFSKPEIERTTRDVNAATNTTDK